MAALSFTVSGITETEKDTIAVCYQCMNDKHPNTVDLIPGAYRDENGKPWVMPFIHKLEKEMLESPNWNHEYVIFLGLDPYMTLVPPLILGDNCPALKTGRAFGIQTVSGTGALRIGAELLARHSKFNTFYLSDPTWDTHDIIFSYGGFKNSRTYRYWDPVKRGLNFEGLLEDLDNAPENAVIVLQICAHNPTGCDLTRDQWIQIADVMQKRKLFPFFDAAYQGLGSGDLEEDAWPVRYFVQRGFEMFIAQTFSKNMGLYSDRIGCLTLVLNDGRQQEIPALKLMMTVIVRAMYLCPTRIGSELVIKVLQNPQHCEEWQKCLRKMAEQLKEVRQALKDRLVKLGTPGSWEHITEQKGMFSFTALTRKQVAYLAEKYHLYMLLNGRVNMFALNNKNLNRFAEAVHDAVLNCPQYRCLCNLFIGDQSHDMTIAVTVTLNHKIK
ncbi:hypothetical protein L9F63_001836 [Diploptera punctata]|uniref:aspartate transaminase n=1 Tax=Diploptera punctata TaxID=6984 RepID=A0AAD8A382_DIPPU|nr:hypothetical protein L9F63_001836 [Diploptera punctata]